MNPLAPAVPALLRQLAPAVGLYPDSAQATVALARAVGVDPGRLVLTNGGSEAVAFSAGLEPAGSIEEPEFSLYRRHLGRVDPAAPWWRSNPNNPLVQLAAPGERAHVWDKAFYPLTTGAWTRGDHAWRIGSLTKLWACPGLRNGYLIAPDEGRAEAICARQPTWSVNSLALAAVPRLLEATDLAGWRKQLRDLRSDLQALVESHSRPFERGALDPGRPRPRTVTTTPPPGIINRDCTSFGMPGAIRIAVPTEGGLDRIDRALR